MKYTCGDNYAPLFNTELTATSNSIKTKGIEGTNAQDGYIYRYYIYENYETDNSTNAKKWQYETTSIEDKFEFTGLTPNRLYTIIVEVRNIEKDETENTISDELVGTITKQIKTIDANKPELLGFNPEMTYYVTYEGNEQEGYNEVIGEKIANDGSNIPNGWYDYSAKKWANIVVTDGTVENGRITGATVTTYYTWIPRYEYKVTPEEEARPSNAHADVRFIQGASNEVDHGYEIPEAFWWDKNSNGQEDEGEQLTGYWAMKYTAGD